jgi:hypothetical protein
VQNPFRSEAEAFRFVITTLVYFVVIAIGAVINVWLGLGIFIGLTALAAFFLFRGPEPERRPQTESVRPAGSGNERRILVVANETVLGRELRECIRSKSEGYRESVLVVTPALNSPMRHWTSDEDGARAAASERLERSIARLQELGVAARGEVGDSEPLQAIEDYARMFGPDEIIISTHPEGRSHWLERGVVSEARKRLTIPITHVVVDLEAEG